MLADPTDGLVPVSIQRYVGGTLSLNLQGANIAHGEQPGNTLVLQVIRDVLRDNFGIPGSYVQPLGWSINWDNSGTLVYLGSPGTGNVSNRVVNPQSDASASAYGAAHTGWYPQLLAVLAGVAHPVGLPPGFVANWDGSGTFVYVGSNGTGNVATQLDPLQWGSPNAYAEAHPGWYAQLLAVLNGKPWIKGNNWVTNWGDGDGPPTLVYLGSPGTGNISHQLVNPVWDQSQAEYSAAHPGWYPQLLAVLSGVALPVGLPPGWVSNWDGSGTFVRVGSNGTGNVATQLDPLQWESPEAYGDTRPGWYAQLQNVLAGVPWN